MDTTVSYCNKNIGPDWSSLNSDLTQYIFRKLPTTSDLISCRNVCRSWCYVSHNHIISKLPIKSPVLVLPKHYLPSHLSESSSYFFHHGLVDTQLHCFFNPVAYELYPISEKSKELLKWRVFVGSSNGWAIFAGVSDLITFNAPTGTAVRCPVSPPYGEIKKALLVGDPILDMMRKRENSHGISVAMCNTNRLYGLSYAQLGDNMIRSFIYTDPEIVYSYDVICSDGLLYAVFDKGTIQAWDFNQISNVHGYSNPKKVPERCYHPRFNQGKELHNNDQLYLVDSSGELWLVSKLGFWVYSKIRVYKMDFKENKWVDMDSLGDRAVFLSKSQSLSFLPLDSSEYKKNCVYFEDREETTASRRPRRGICVYNLEDGSVAIFYEEQLVTPPVFPVEYY